jgi:hypothetical protein
LRRIFGPKRVEVTGKLRKLHKEELNLCSSPTIVRVIKSRRIRWAGNIARMEEGIGVCRVLVGKPDGKRPLGRVDGRIILRWIFRRWDMAVWSGLSWLRIGTGGWQL